MNPQKVTQNIRFFNVFSARRTFAMGPRMAQALKNQENSMLFTTFYAKIMKTKWFCLLFCAPGNDLARLTGARNGPEATKTKKTKCFSQLCMQKSRKLDGFAYFLVPLSTTSQGSAGSLSTAATISKSNENTMFFVTFCRKAMKTQCFSMVWERGLGVQSHESTKSN